MGLARTSHSDCGQEVCKLDTGERSVIASQNNDAADLLAVQKTLQGSTRAFGEIVERYTPILYSLAYRLLGDLEEAEDAVQDIFFKAFRSLKGFKLNNRFYTWIYTIGLNLLRSRLRKRKRRHPPIALPTDSYGRPILADDRENPEQTAINADANRRAQQAIGKLKPIYRTVFVLKHVQELRISDISRITGVPSNTVKVRLHRARHALAEYLSDEEPT